MERVLSIESLAAAHEAGKALIWARLLEVGGEEAVAEFCEELDLDPEEITHTHTHTHTHTNLLPLSRVGFFFALRPKLGSHPANASKATRQLTCSLGPLSESILVPLQSRTCFGKFAKLANLSIGYEFRNARASGHGRPHPPLSKQVSNRLFICGVLLRCAL